MVEYLKCDIVIYVCKHFKPAQSSLRKLAEFSRERSILNITLHGKTKCIFISLVCFFFPSYKNAKFTMIETYPKLILRILQIVCLHWSVVLEGVTRNKLKSQTTGVLNVDIFKMFLLGFENMNRSSGAHESPSSTGGLRSVKIN